MKGPTRYMRERMLLKNKPRKVLNLEERVEAIKLYERSPVYQRVASNFKCSWEQIKNIISKREAILNYYARCQIVNEKVDGPRLARQKKINFLGNVMYEYIKRAYYHESARITDDTIRQRALEFRNIIKIDKFYPNKAWVTDFKHVYNVDLDQLAGIVIVETPKKSLNCKDIVSHCREQVQKVLEAAERYAQEGAQAVKAVDDDIVVLPEADDELDIDYDDVDGEQVDDEAEIENESGQVIYYGDDDINEDEEGPTINYGDYDYDEEESELKPMVTIAGNNELLEYDMPITAMGETTTTKLKAEPATSSAKRKRTAESERSYSSSPSLLSTSTSTMLIAGAKNVATAARAQEQIKDIDSHAEALSLLRPLEDFALREEDFTALNLLAQLTANYEKALKRRRVPH